MNKDKKEIKEEVLFEFHFKVTNKTYKIGFSSRKKWLISVGLILIRLIMNFAGKSP